MGNLFEAEDEAREWRDLHAAIRVVSTHYQTGEEMPDWQVLDALLRSVRQPQSDAIVLTVGLCVEIAQRVSVAAS